MVVIVMGVSGSGKSTIGRLLAERLSWRFVEGDDWHPAANVRKLSAGIPLTEEDRRPWLLTLRDEIARWLSDGSDVVLACSALRQSYRDLLTLDPQRMRIVYLKGTPALLPERLRRRGPHIMAPSLLPSQLETLEEPPDGVVPPAAITVDIAHAPDEIVRAVVERLGW